MKRLTLYRLINVSLLAIFAISLMVQNYAPLFSISLKFYWFPLFCLLMGISLLFKTVIFKSDSALWLGVSLILISLSLFSSNIYNLSYKQYWPVVFIIPAMSSLFVGIIFKQWFQIKICLFLLLISIPFFLFSFNILNIWLLILLLIIDLSLTSLVGKLLPERWYLNSKKN